MLNAHCTRRKATLHFSLAIAAKVKSLVTDILTDVLIHFPNIAQHSKDAHYFDRVVGLVVINIHQWMGMRPVQLKFMPLLQSSTIVP